MAELAPIVIALIAAAGTIAVALINSRRTARSPSGPVPPPPPAEDLDLTPTHRLLVLETHVATLRREHATDQADCQADQQLLREDLGRLTRRFEEHLDRGTGRVPTQRRPAET